MRSGVVLAVVAAALGCGGKDDRGGFLGPSSQTVERGVSDAQSEKTRKFKAAVAVYLEEARVGAKMLTIVPSVADAENKARQIRELYTRIPDVPPEIDTTGRLAERLKNINGGFHVAAAMVAMRKDFLRLGSVEDVKNHEKAVAKTSVEIRDIATEIEAMMAGK